MPSECVRCRVKGKPGKKIMATAGSKYRFGGYDWYITTFKCLECGDVWEIKKMIGVAQ